ncbi:MAG: hypothetical protein HQM01_10505 [Magnetococcales bacterium]|nr:hypothetical protein [Magnetococcales bacterium]
MPGKNRRKLSRRAMWLISVLVLTAVSALLVWQLLPGDSGRNVVMGKIRQKAGELRARSQEGSPAPPVAAPPVAAPPVAAPPVAAPPVVKPPVAAPPVVKPPVAAPPVAAVSKTPVRLTGCVEGDCQNGVGTFIHDDGARYVGNWSKGKKHGSGEFRFPAGGGYRGIWQNGQLTKIQ